MTNDDFCSDCSFYDGTGFASLGFWIVGLVRVPVLLWIGLVSW